jgi:nucleoside-diphosphate-sugar epimerase
VYGESLNTDEDVSCYPISINGLSKLLNEKIISEFCIKNSIKYNILRVFNMYGGCDKFSIISHIGHSLINGVPFTLNNFGVAQRDFIHVADVAKIVVKLLNKDIQYTHLNIGTGNTTKIATLVKLVIEKYPDLTINNSNLAEVEYSRANINRLLNLVEIDFIRIIDNINDEINKYLKRD